MKQVALLSFLFAPAAAGETTYTFGTMEARTNITFESKTDLETIIGSTNQASGWAAVDFDKNTVNVEITVAVASLRTGIDMRDDHLRSEQWLDAKKFPNIVFKAKKADRKGDEWNVSGTLSLHGVEKDCNVFMNVRQVPDELAKKANLGPGSWLRVRATFNVKLTDYGVKVPEKAAAKVSNDVAITIDLFGTTEKPKDAQPMPESSSAKGAKAGDVKVEGDGVRYKFGAKPQLTNMTAESKTDLETIIAASGVVGGAAVVDVEKGTGKVKLVVPVKSLKTGIEMRDEHLRGEHWLEADKHPDIVFESTKVTKKDDKTWTVHGTFTMHGVGKEMIVEVQARAIPADLIKKAGWGEKPGLGFRTSFKVKLSDHGVKVPEMAAAKVQDEWTVSFDAVAIQE